LFAKKSHNAINVISGVSVCGVALATLALVCTLSVFNGFQDLVATFFTAFDPELKITAVNGKVFDSQDNRIQALRQLPEVEVFSESLEDQAMVQYKGKQTMVSIKGIQDNFRQLTAIDSILFGRGDMVLKDEIVDYAIPGIELVSILGSGVRFVDPLEVYAPKRGSKINMANPANSFKSSLLYSSGLVFAVNQQKYDASYVLTSLEFARDLFQYDTEVSSIELRLKDSSNLSKVKNDIGQLLGEDFNVSDRYEQQADTFRIMEVEKLISYIFLTFILLIACFNVIGSLSMLIIDKQADVSTLRNLGADDTLITRIFLFEGALISLIANATLAHKEVTVELAEKITEKIVGEQQNEVTIDKVQKAVCDYFNISLDTLLSKTRKRQIVQARQIAMYLSRNLINCSLSTIGAEIGGKDHATVLHACSTVGDLMSTDKTFKQYVNDIEKILVPVRR
jgi:lipoprotein-releasing system permease protein